MKLSNHPFEELAQAKMAIIKQQVELAEIITGCETKNRYHVYILKENGEGVYLFMCKESSSCWSRNCCE